MNRLILPLIGIMFVGLASCNTTSSPSSPGTTTVPEEPSSRTVSKPQREDKSAEATLQYWAAWKTSLARFKAAAEQHTEYSVENSNALSSLYSQIADELGQLSAVDVDSELTALAANAILMYRNRSNLLKEQANILSTWNTFEAKRDSDETAGVGVLVFLFNENDRFAVPRALAEEAEQIRAQWNNNFSLLEQQYQNILNLIAQRDALKVNLEAKYGVVFGNF